MKQFFKQLFNKKQKSKIMTGKKVKLVMNPSSTPSSTNTYRGDGKEYIVINKFEKNSWQIKTLDDISAGWVYEWEMEISKIDIKELTEELLKVKSKVDDIQTKIDYLNETGSDEFSEDEFKVYQTLKLLENGKLSMLEKSKLIAELIKK